MTRRVLWLSVLICACGEDGHWTRQRSAIVNGSRDPEIVGLAPNQVRAIGWLHPSGSPGDNYCTGTLIAPRVVATAEHCVTGADASEIGFGFGLEPSAPEGVLDLAAIYPHPGEDAAMLLLAESATVAPWFLVPIPANQDAISAAAIGKALEAAGYGDTMDPSRDGRWFATVYLDQIGTNEVVVDGRGIEGICHGDSGGPLLDTNASGQPVVLAVESWGDSSCVDQDVMVRLDALADWMAPVFTGGSPLDPCEGLTELGRCTGDLLEWCQRGEIRSLDCASLGTTCGHLGEAVGYDCLCGDLTYQGRCDRGVAEYCDDGAYRRVNCERRGGSCGWIDDETGYFCTEMPACRPEDEAGRCEGQVAMSCSNGLNTRRLCAIEGLSCSATTSGANCLSVDAGASDAGAIGPLTDAGMEGDGSGPGADAERADTAPTRDAGASIDGGEAIEEEGGCGCTTERSSRASAPWVLLAVILATRRRR